LKQHLIQSGFKRQIQSTRSQRELLSSGFFGSLCGQARSNPMTSSDLVPIRSGNKAGLLAATSAEQFDGKMPLAAFSSNGFISPC